ncbi:MAG: hypothetical protein L3J09_12795 [Flavobacteriaceae bacterium]|nr:hypothetical protein [Flavobacteriaceae bacterium]
MIKKILILLMLGISFSNCTNNDIEQEMIENNNDDNDNDDDEVSLTDAEFFENFGETVVTDIIGRVSDQEGNYLENVEIKSGTQTLFTDSNGYFLLTDVEVNERFAYVKASKVGFIDGSRTIVPNKIGATQMSITLLEKNVIATLESGQQGVASLSNGSKVIFEGAFSTASGNPYNGSVEVSMHYLAPNILSTYSEMPGNLIGRTGGDELRGLETYGMIAVSLFASDGSKLNLSENSFATIELPIDNSQLSVAPETIPLWYFDEELGYWREEGVATKIDGKYVGQVSHFSFWNCDDFLTTTTLCINVVDLNNNPVSNHTVSLIRNATENNVGVGVTNESGQVCGEVPVDESLTLMSYYIDCSGQNATYEQSIGPFTNSTTITIILSFADFETSVITGTVVNCDTETPVEEGYVFFENAQGDYAYPLDNGTFEFNATYCTQQNEAIVIGYDIVNLVESPPIEFNITSSQTPLGQINTCEDTDTGDENANIFTGDVTLSSQEEVDLFGTQAYTKIEGSLLVLNDPTTLITNLDALQTIIVITEDFSIIGNHELTSLFGLQSLKRVENDLIVFNNQLLADVTGILNIEVIGNNFIFKANDAATSLDGFQNITSVNDLLIVNNENLLSLEGLNGITSIIGDLYIGDGPDLSGQNTNLQNVNALSNLTSVGGRVRLSANPALIDLSGFDALQTVGTYCGFYDLKISGILNAFNSLETVGYQLGVTGNDIQEIAGFNSLHTVDALNLDGNSDPNNSITLISGFNSLTSGIVSIRYFESLVNISGFDAIVNLERIDVVSNNSLTSVTGFNNVESVETIFAFQSNPLLNDLSGFSSLESVSSMIISNNNSLENFQDLSSINEITSRIDISWCDGLINLTGLENVTAIGTTLVVEECSNIENLEGLNNVTTIGGYMEIQENNNMTSMNGLESLISVEDVLIGYYHNVAGSNILPSQNLSLSDFCALQNLFTNGSYADVYLGYNLYNPTVQDIIDGNCSL